VTTNSVVASTLFQSERLNRDDKKFRRDVFEKQNTSPGRKLKIMRAPLYSARRPFQIFFTLNIARWRRTRQNRQRECRGLVPLFQNSLASSHFAQSPAFVLLAGFQPEHRVGESAEKDAEAYLAAGDGADEGELRAFRLRLLCRLGRNVGRSGNGRSRRAAR